MADVEDGPAFARELAQRRKENLGLLGCQDRSGFIQNQQARVLQQTSDDLDALALSHREVVDMPVRMQGQPIVLRRGFETAPQFIKVLRRQCQSHVFQCGHRLEE